MTLEGIWYYRQACDIDEMIKVLVDKHMTSICKQIHNNEQVLVNKHLSVDK